MNNLEHASKQVSPTVLTEEIWKWVFAHLDAKPVELRLKHGNQEPFYSAISQVEARARYSKKFKDFICSRWVFPVGIGLEQSSSVATAKIKQRLFRAPYSADLCGGLGMDSYFICERLSSKKHVVFERNLGLAQLLKHNLTASKVISSEFNFDDLDDWIKRENIHTNELEVYLDPDRRSNDRRSFSILEGAPNLVSIQGDLLTRCAKIIAKHSPMVDLNEIESLLLNLSEIHIIQYQGECKEVLSVQEKGYEGSVNIVLIDAETEEEFNGQAPSPSANVLTTPKGFIIQPSAGLNKSGFHMQFAQIHQWSKLVFGNLYTSQSEPPQSVFYKIFRVNKVFNSLKKAELAGPAAIESIGSKISSDELRKRFKIKEGRERKIFYLQNGTLKMIVACKLIE
jgi:hypothetical protein